MLRAAHHHVCRHTSGLTCSCCSTALEAANAGRRAGARRGPGASVFGAGLLGDTWRLPAAEADRLCGAEPGLLLLTACTAARSITPEPSGCTGGSASRGSTSSTADADLGLCCCCRPRRSPPLTALRLRVPVGASSPPASEGSADCAV